MKYLWFNRWYIAVFGRCVSWWWRVSQGIEANQKRQNILNYMFFFNVSTICQIAFCADMNSHLVQYEQQRHWTGQVIKSNIHQTLYWSSLPRGSGELNPNPHFWILLPCQWVPVLAPSCLILLQSEYLFTLWQRVAEMNPKCDELLYYVNRRPTCLCVW